MAKKIPCIFRKVARWIAIVLVWRLSDRPDSMWMGNRGVLDDIADGEAFVYRTFADWFPDGDLNRDQISVPNCSVNRLTNSEEWWHVLLPDPPLVRPEPRELATRRKRNLCRGVVKFSVIPGEYIENGRAFRFQVCHAPEEHNYLHCEMRIFEGDRQLTNAELKDSLGNRIKKHYRNKLVRNIEILLEAEVSTKNSSVKKTS